MSGGEFTERKINDFMKRFIKKIKEDKPFSIGFNNESIYVSRGDVEKIRDLILSPSVEKEGGILPFLPAI